MKPAKYSKKYAKIQSKAELCTTREEALKLLDKAEKLQKKTRVFTPAYDWTKDGLNVLVLDHICRRGPTQPPHGM